MKTKLLIFALIIASCFFKTATAQVVTSVDVLLGRVLILYAAFYK